MNIQQDLNIKPLIADINTVLRATLTRIGLGDSRLLQGDLIRFDESVTFTVKFKEYAHYIDTGRRPNQTPPPIAPILEFIERRNINPANITRRQLAFAISKSIGKKGIKARPFLDDLHKELTELIKIHIFEEVQKQFLNIFN